MSKEEKAKEYNSWRKFVSDYRIWTPALEKACKIAEKQGYKKAEQDLSSQLTAYKEALNSLWSDIHFTDISKMDIMDRIGSLIQPKP